MFIYVAGIPGTGKTSVIKGLVERLNDESHKALRIRGLPILCHLAGDISPEEFRKLPDDVRGKYRPEMFRIIYEEDKNDPYTIRILDGHFIYFEVEGKDFSVRNIRNEDYEQMKAIFVVNSTPENILNRRIKDISERNDRVIDFNYIQEQLELEKNEAIKQAKELGISIDFINNNGDLKETIQEINNKVRERLNLSSEIKENSFGKIKLS